jgi:aspartate dehydrogenase
MRQALRVAFIGWGAIGRRVGALLADRSAPVHIVGVATRSEPPAGHLPRGAVALSSPEELAPLRPDLVVEAAGRAAVEPWAGAALACSRALILASTSALGDDGLLARLVALAERQGSRILVPPGAMGGVDALAAAAVLELHEVQHVIIKPPAAWRGTEAETLIDLAALQAPETFFAGSAREAAERFPQNANATVVTALAGLGLDRTRVELVADPAAHANGHRITAAGAFGRLEIRLDNRPLATNPKSSELTALSLVRLIENEARALVL